MIGPTNRWGLDVGAHLFQVRQMTHLLVVSDKRSTNGQIPSVAATVSGLFQCWPSGHPSFNLGIFRPSLSQAYIRSRCSWPQVAPRFDRKVRNFRSFPCGDRRLTFDMKAGKARLGSADHSFGSTGPELSTGGNHDLGELGVPGTALIAGTIASHHSGPDVVGEPRNYPAGIGNVG